MTLESAPSALLSVRDLKVHFKFSCRTSWFQKKVQILRAVDGISFELAAGETLGIVGESGCGKSTLARAILRLMPRAQGQVLYRGEDLLQVEKAEMQDKRRSLQMIFQDPLASLNPRMTVGQIIAEPLWTFQKHFQLTRVELLKRVLEMMRSVGLLPEYINRYPHEFSGGQCQRIGIARALILKPEVLICDEPVSALDVSIQAQIINLLMAIQKEMQLSLLFIAHNLNVVHHISHRVMVMYLGRVMEMGTVESLYAQPLHPYTRMLLEALPVPRPDIQRKKAVTLGSMEPASRLWPAGGCVFRMRCPMAVQKCAEEVPELKRHLNGTWVACHRV